MRKLLFGMVMVALAGGGPSPSAGQDVLLVVNKSESTLSFIDVASAREFAEVETGHAPHEVVVSPDGRWAYVSDYGTGPRPGNTITIVDVAARSRVGTIDLGQHTRPHGLAVTDDGYLWVTTEGSAHVLKVDPATRTVVLEAETAQRTTHMVVAAGHERIYTANIGSGTVTAVDATTGGVVAQIATGAGSEGIALSPDGEHVYVTNRSAGTMSRIEVASDTVTGTLEVGAFPIRVEILPNGVRALVSNAQANELAVVNLRLWQVERRIPVGEVPVGIEIAPDGATAFVANTQADKVSVVDLTEWQVTGEVVAGDEPDGMAMVQGTQ